MELTTRDRGADSKLKLSIANDAGGPPRPTTSVPKSPALPLPGLKGVALLGIEFSTFEIVNLLFKLRESGTKGTIEFLGGDRLPVYLC
jgi:hypothetical protein